MTHAMTPEFNLVKGKGDTVGSLNDLKARYERGEIECAAIRLYKSDDTYEDVVIGGDEATQQRALAQLHASLRAGCPVHH